jgi:hypothetical protein
VLNGNGNVGIGTATPGAPLHVSAASNGSGGNGQLWLSDANNVNQQLRLFSYWNGGYAGSYASINSIQVGSGATPLILQSNGGAVILPYIVWHFNWSSAQYVGVVGSSSIVNSINSTNISGTYINTPSSGRFTVPHSGVYICTFDACSTVDARTVVLLRIDGTNYNPYASMIGNYAVLTYTEVLYLTAGQVIDWYCSIGGLQATNVLQANNGSGKGISFALMR